MRLLPFVEKFLTSDIIFENIGQYRKIILINSILFFATFIFLFFGIYNIGSGKKLIALFDFIAAVVIFGAIIDLRLNKNVTRAGDIGIWSLFSFFLLFVYVNNGNDFGLIWTIFFPVFVILIRSKSGIPFILLYYGILFTMAYLNIGVWQEGAWSHTAFIRLAAASTLLTYVVYVSEQSRAKADEKNDELLKREQELNVRLQEYQRELESKVKKTLTELSEKEKIILRNSQLAEMGNLIGVIAHQLKQPLNAINILTYGIKDSYLHQELDDAYLEKTTSSIAAQVAHMSSTVDDFRDFFNPNKKKKRFDVANAIEKTLQLLLPQLEQSGIEVKQHLDEGVEILGFESELQQVLINLIHNAKDAMVENGVPTPRLRITCTPDTKKKRVLITVEDNGGGIPEAIREKIFTFYFTTKKESGTGIGLYLAKKIVETSFNGVIEAENSTNGARFSIALPLP